MNHQPIKPDPERKPKRPADANQRAKMVVDLATGEAEEKAESPRASAGRKGGEVGGKARAEKLAAERRREIAKKAAQARWGSQGPN